MDTSDENEQSRDDEGPRLPWYQRPWLSSADGVNWIPTSWGGLAALLAVVIGVVVAANWISSLF